MLELHDQRGLMGLGTFGNGERMPELEAVGPVLEFHINKIIRYRTVNYKGLNQPETLFMKKVFSFLFILITYQFSFSQNGFTDPYPKKITVSGSAELELIPDEIFVNIKLQEYQKKNQDKRDLDIIKSEFLTACSTAGIPDSCISIYSYDGFNNYLWSKRKKAKDAELLTSITFQVKFSSSIQMDKLIEKLDDEATKSFDIENTSHSRMTEYRKQVKVQAIKAARDKAVYLLEAIGEKPVVLVSVTELDEPVFPTTYYQYNSLYNNNYQDSMNSPSTDIIFKKIKIRSEVQVVYSIR